MIVVKIILNVLAEKQLEITQTLVSLIEPGRQEEGRNGYSIFCDIHDRNRFCLIEEWQTREDLDRHIKSQRFRVLLGTKPLLSEPLKIIIYTVSHREGIEAIEAVSTNGVPYDEYIANVS